MSRAQTIATPAHAPCPEMTDSLRETPLTDLARALENYLRSGAGPQADLAQTLLGAIKVSLAQGDTSAPPPPPRARAALSQRTLRKAEDFIHTNLAMQFSIDDIARAACLSRFHMGRAWHVTTGQSLWQYVLQCRVALACSLINRDPEAQLADVAAQSGFESYSQFIAAFRKRHGVTPGDWRRLLH